MEKNRKIGIVGGVGPLAGIRLAEKIVENTNAKSDQEHLSVILLSESNRITDRTAFLTGQEITNPAEEILKISDKLISLGADVIGIPCNTAHTKKIMNVIEEGWNEEILLVNMFEEVILYLQQNLPKVKRVGVLTTQGLAEENDLFFLLEKHGYEPVLFSNPLAGKYLHEAIYHEEFGIKANGHSTGQTSYLIILDCIKMLIRSSAEVVILGCTELSLAFSESYLLNVPVIDTLEILARALIRNVDENKLKLL